MERLTLFVDVIVPLAVPERYTYRVPFELNDEVEVGKRAIVQFGKKRLYTALICEIKTQANPKYEAKYLDLIIDAEPILPKKLIEFWTWMSFYYMCTPGDVMNAALPSNLKFSSQTVFIADEASSSELDALSIDDRKVYQMIKEKEGISLQDISNSKHVPISIKRLIDCGLVFTEEEIKDSYKSKKEIFVEIEEDYSDENGLQKAMNLLQKSEKQLDVLLAFVDISGILRNGNRRVERIKILKKVDRSSAAIVPLIKKGIFKLVEFEVDRIHSFGEASEELPTLSKEQNTALNEIKKVWDKKGVSLLEGVTSSGKTLVYAKLIKEVLARGEQVLYILPEIGLTIHLISRLKKYFGKEMGVYHSKFRKDERVEIWNKVLTNDENGGRFILGARSSVFLPFQKLGLIVVDEEHDSSLKQFQPAPRYHARDSAIVLAKILNSPIILGSATPAIESRWLAMQGKYNWVKLTKRFGNIRLPEIEIVDLKKEANDKWRVNIFSKLLINLTRHDLDLGHQVIYFQNRRGYAPLWICKECGWIPRCKDCDVNLTYHMRNHILSCHYCGQNYNPPIKCNACGSSKLSMPGFGTERVEEEIAAFLPDKKIARLDLDSTRTKHAYEKILNRFEEKEIDLLVGTQMIAKGLDFDNVQLVGILNADMMLNFPDFRAFERAFQMMVQVAGRAGRLRKQGKVIIQTHYPDHWVLEKVKQHDYSAFYKKEIVDRKNFLYPPFYRLIRLILIDKEKSVVDKAASQLADRLKLSLKDRVLGPETPYISRIRNRFYVHILVKIERNMSPHKVREFIQSEIDHLRSQKAFKSIRLHTDVDPV
jgi:primosomal protein N' (replication factor Y)